MTATKEISAIFFVKINKNFENLKKIFLDTPMDFKKKTAQFFSLVTDTKIDIE